MRFGSIILPLLAVIPVLTGCKGDRPADPSAEDVSIVRLDEIVAAFPGMDAERQELELASYSTPLSDYLYMMGLTDADLKSSIDTLSQSAAYSYFYPDVAQFLNPIFDELEKSVGHVDGIISSTFTSIPPHKFYGVISPYNQQIMMVDSTMFIALNHYLGEDYAGYQGMPEYQRRIKTPEHLPYDVAEAAIAVAYPYEPSDEASALNRMLYEGALSYGVVNAVDGGGIAEFLGWTADEYKLVKESEADIWNLLITNRLLYSTDTAAAERLVAPSPATTVLSPLLPGRVGRYVGYAIVESYLKSNPDVSIEDLLQPSFYNDNRSLINARYSPGT